MSIEDSTLTFYFNMCRHSYLYIKGEIMKFLTFNVYHYSAINNHEDISRHLTQANIHASDLYLPKGFKSITYAIDAFNWAFDENFLSNAVIRADYSLALERLKKNYESLDQQSITREQAIEFFNARNEIKFLERENMNFFDRIIIAARNWWKYGSLEEVSFDYIEQKYAKQGFSDHKLYQKIVESSCRSGGADLGLTLPEFLILTENLTFEMLSGTCKALSAEEEFSAAFGL